jgi:hypothetical protein
MAPGEILQGIGQEEAWCLGRSGQGMPLQGRSGQGMPCPYNNLRFG